MKGVTAAQILLSAIYTVLAVSSGQPVPIEKQLHLLETFETEWCTSPQILSPAPYFTVNGIPLNTDELNRQFGATVNRSNSLEGHHQAKLRIASVKPAVNDSIIIVVCLVNSAVLLEYHLIIVEPQWVPVTNESFQSDLCVSPLVTTLAPYFTCTFANDITLSYAEIHKLYNASVSRSISPEGHHQALLTILSTNPTLNNAIITCWVNSAAILQYRLTIIESSTDPAIATVTAAAMESNTYISNATDAHIHDVNTSTSLKSKSSGLSKIFWIALPVLVLATVIIVGCVILSLYMYRRRKCRPKSTIIDSENPPISESLDGSLNETSLSATPKSREEH